MIYFCAAACCAALILILTKSGLAQRMAGAPGLMLAAGAGISVFYRAAGGPGLPSEWIASFADAGLAALGFAAAAQFRVTKLAASCPASFKLAIGGAPLYLVLCGVAAFILAPQLSLASAFLLGGALTLNGAAFDRRSVSNAPAPSLIKSAVRLESAAILALGLPIVMLLEGAAAAAPAGAPAITPIYFASLSVLIGFGFGGASGLIAAWLGERWRLNHENAYVAGAAALIGFIVAPMLGGHPVVAAAAAGLIWGEQTGSFSTTRVRMRRTVENSIAPLGYLFFGMLLAPRFFQGDLPAILFALAAVTLIRALPRLIALKNTNLPKASQGFLAWFGGAPGAASALYLITLFDNAALVAQDAILTVGALAIVFGVFIARLTSQPLLKFFLKETALAKKRAAISGST